MLKYPPAETYSLERHGALLLMQLQVTFTLNDLMNEVELAVVCGGKNDCLNIHM